MPPSAARGQHRPPARPQRRAPSLLAAQAGAGPRGSSLIGCGAGRCHVGGSGASPTVEIDRGCGRRVGPLGAASCSWASLRSGRREAAAGGMERSRMNLPTGPDTLCFDKDEFMKVPGRFSPEPGRGGPPPSALRPRGLPTGSGLAGAAWRKPFCEMGRFGWKDLEVVSRCRSLVPGPWSRVPGSAVRWPVPSQDRSVETSVLSPEDQEFRPEQIAERMCLLPGSGPK